jgi:DNA mismatch repair protein MutL
VHPQKLEVKFSEQNIIMKDIKNVLRENLMEKTKFNLSFEKVENKKSFENNNNIKDFTYDDSDYKTNNIFKERSKSDFSKNDNSSFKGNNESFVKEPVRDYGYSQSFFEERKISKSISDDLSINENKDKKRIIGVANTRYLLIEDAEQIIIMDFHAAHERVIFEKLKKQFFDENRIKRNKLLIPIETRISFEEKEEILEHKDIINQIGIDFSFDDEVLKIETLPLGIKIKDPKAMIREILDTLRLEGIESLEKIHEDALATMACRSAVKTGDDVVGLEKLVSDVFEMKLKTCPHGRPIMMNMSYKKLDDFFGR